MPIDLHTHSRRSDGTDAPAALIGKARAAGLLVVALTDHDTTQGWEEAAQAADQLGITLIPGIEVSTRYQGRGVHLLAYLPDPDDPALTAELALVLAGRNSRLPAVVERLRAAGVGITVSDVERVSGHAAATGRPHVADALVALGAAHDRDEAFAKWLSPGRPGYVDRYAADLVDMIGIVRNAGGVSVLAHPWSRSSRRVLTAQALADLRRAGLAGIEVDHNDHPADVRAQLRGLAADLDLVATGSSDYHGIGKVGFDLGCNTTTPEQFDILMSRARRASADAGLVDRVPAVTWTR
ncbi:MAG: PHP domain-containing protein [Nocardioidaceae bacterium]